ncbi:MAG: molecular chaperone TorD family protein [Eggerthellaceae bacterium]|nr:molecular chaperone TorD family protein [Eggerthellaceae bacterium]
MKTAYNAEIFASFRADIRAAMESRANMYGLLSCLYEKEADKELLDTLCSMRMPASTGNAHVDAGYKLLARYLNGRWERTEEELRIDYFRAFLGNGVDGNGAAYPFESVHTSPDRVMMQDARDEVLTLYRAEGMAKSETWKDGEDHIALELAFEKVVCEKCVRLLDAGEDEQAMDKIQVQYHFLQDHLNNWVPLMMEDMLRFAKTDFYHGVAQLTSGFLENDEEFLGELLEALTGDADD